MHQTEAWKPSLGSGFMTSLKLAHQDGLQTFGEKRLSGFSVVGVPSKGENKTKKRKRDVNKQKETLF